MRKTSVLWSFVIFLLPLLTLWYLLFHPGLYAYADQHFPLSTKMPASSIISLNPLNGFSFDRLFLTWPYYIFSIFTTSMAIIERLFLYYVFLVYAFLCYIFSSVAVRYYSNKVHHLSSLEMNGGKLAILIVAYSNLSALNLNSDGGAWADSVILILISISIILILNDSGSLKTYTIISGLMLLSILLDPDYVPMFWLAVILVSLVKGLMRKGELRSIAYSVISVLVSVISILYLYVQGLLTGPLTSSALSALGYRSYSAGSVASYSSNITPYNVLILFGHLWSTIVYAPPSVVFYRNIFNLPALYSPAQVIAVPGAAYYMWIIALASIPIFAFSSLIFKSTRKAAIPLFVLFIAAYLITQEWNFRIIYDTFHLLVNVPIFGSAIGTSLSLPGHFINLIAYTYLPLFSLGTLTVIYYSSRLSLSSRSDHESSSLTLSLNERDRDDKKRKIHVKTAVTVVVIFLLVSLAGWQAFSGSNYPMRASPGSFLLGDSVEPKGVFAPTEINASVIKAYDIAVSNYREGYNTIWIGGPSVNEFTYSQPPNSVSESGLSYLAANNLYTDVEPYLEAHSVKYVVVSNADISDTGPNPFTGYGFNNYSQAKRFLNESGLTQIYSENDISIYELPNVVGSVYYSNILLNATGVGTQSGTFYRLWNLVGLNASFSPNGTQMGLNSASDSIDVIAPTQLPESGVVAPVSIPLGYHVNSSLFMVYDNSTDYIGYREYYQNNSLSQFVSYLPGNFTTTNWGGNVSFNYSNGTLVASGKNASFSLGYNGSLAGQPGGLKIADDKRSVQFTISFSANVSADFKGSMRVNIIGEALNSSEVTYFGGFPFNVSDHPEKYEFNATIPEGTSYVGFRIGFYSFTGSIELSYANFTVSSVAVPNLAAPFGNSVPLKNATLSLPVGFRTGLVVYSTGNNYTPLVATISKDHNITAFSGRVQAIILLKNSSIDELLGKYAVINEGISREDHVTLNGRLLSKYFSGNDGSYIYPLSETGKAVVSVQQHIVYELYFFYIIIIALSFLLMVVGIRPGYASITLQKLMDRMNSMKMRKS